MRGTIDRSAASRLPRTGNQPGRGAQIVQGLVALVATAFVVVGVPILLLVAFGNPLPDEAPTMEWLTRPTTTETVLGVLAAVVWLAWAHFVVCLVIEAVSEARRTMAPHVPGGGVGTQALARRAVVTIALLAGTTATTLGSASAAVAPQSAHEVGSQASYSASQTATPQTQARTHADQVRTTGLPGASDLLRATAQDVTEGATTSYEVHPPEGRNYDTLWDIAERYLGSGIRYKEIFELNKDLTQGDGRSLQIADLIQPGWVLRLPSDAKGPGLKVVSHVSELPGGNNASGASVDGGGATATADDAAMADGAGGAGGAGGAETGPLISESWAPFFGVAGGLALAGAFLGLRRRRNSLTTRQLWAGLTRGKGPDPDPQGPGPQGPGPGASLRDEVDTGLAGWLDRALRSFGAAAPAPIRAWVGATGVALAFEEPQPEPPSPWQAAGDHTWTLAREANVSAHGASAVPGLVAAGSRGDGSLLMIDPESVPGVLALSGEAGTARGLAASMAVDTATHPWADRRLVTMVGFADDLTGVGQGAIRRTDDLGRLLEALDNQARYQRAACRKAGVASAREGRASAPELIDWQYHLVICSGVPAADQLARLTEMAADPMLSLGVVVIGDVQGAAMALSVRGDGSLSAPLFGIEARAQVLGVKAARELAALYEVEAHPRPVALSDLADRIEAEGLAAPAADAAVRIGVLGPVTVAANGEVEDERREFLTELATFLALHPRGVHANLVSAALWPRGVEDSTRDNALRQLGAWFGTTSDGEPVLGQDNGVRGFRAGAVALDWDGFRATLNHAADNPGQAEQHLRQALGMVRGLPFADVPADRWSWLESGHHVDDITLAIALTSLSLAERAAVRGDEDAARATLARGLELLPANEELWCSWLRLESQVGDRDDVREVADRMYAAIAEHGSPVGAAATTDALVDELLPGYRAKVA